MEFDTFFLIYMAFITILSIIMMVGVVYVIYYAITTFGDEQAIPNVIIENTEQCQINCSQCLEYCNTIIDDALQTYIKVKGIGQTVAIREGYT